MFECAYFSITDEQEKEFADAYPALHVPKELLAMKVWLDANPGRRKKNYKRFVVNWLARAQGSMERSWWAEHYKREQARVDARVGSHR